MHPDVNSPRPAPPWPVPSAPAADPIDRDPTTVQTEQVVNVLNGLDELPVAEHVARFDAVHAALTEALSSIDKV